MAKFKKIDKDFFKETYIKHGGKITAICKALRISRDCFYDNLNKSEEVKLMVDFAENDLLDSLETTGTALATGIPIIEEVMENGQKVKRRVGWKERPDRELLMFMLTAKGKDRGYGKEQKIDMKVEGAMNVKGEVSFNLSPLNLDTNE